MTKIDEYKVNICKRIIEGKDFKKDKSYFVDNVFSSNVSLKGLAESLLYKKGYNDIIDINYKKPLDISIVEDRVAVFRNLNFLEKLIFEYHLRNFQKKNNSKKGK